MVFQDPYGSLDPHLTAQEIVAEPLGCAGVRSAAERRRGPPRLIDRVGLPARHWNAGRPSSPAGNGNASASPAPWPAEPELLVCDEATSALDVSVQAQVLDLLRELQADTGLTYIVISHNLGVVREISADVVVMRAGGSSSAARPPTCSPPPPSPTPGRCGARRSTRPRCAAASRAPWCRDRTAGPGQQPYRTRSTQ